MELNYVRKEAVGSDDACGRGVVGWRLHTITLCAGRVVATSEWQGSVREKGRDLGLRRLDGTKIGNVFGCLEEKGVGQCQVRADELRWVPLLADEWKRLTTDQMVATEGQLRWRRLLERVSDTEFTVSFMCSGKVRMARVCGEEIVAVKVERLPVYSIEGVWAGTGQGNGQQRWDRIWILDSRVGDTSMRKLYGEEIWRLQGWPSELLRELEGGGMSTKDCGRLAASEFQQCMADAVMGSVVMRLKFRREMQELEGVVRTLPWLIPEAPKAQSGRVSLLIVRFPEKRGESPQILCCKGREASWRSASRARCRGGLFGGGARLGSSARDTGVGAVPA